MDNLEMSEYSLKLTEIDAEKSYLMATDWYIVRKTETGKDIQAEVLQKRAEAREKINQLEAELVLMVND